MEIFINGTGVISPQLSFDESDFALNILQTNTKNRLSCIEPDYKNYINSSALRRMSRMIKMGIASSKICLADAGIDVPDAIITATGLGCLDDTEKFLRSIEENKEQLLTPTPFIQSTHNTVGGQIALHLNCHEYNFTYVHRGISFESALIDSIMLLQEKSAETVLVGGIDELTDTSFKLLQQLGIYNRRETISDTDYNQTKGGEGAAFFLLSTKKTPKSKAKLTALKIYNGKASLESLTELIQDCLFEAGRSIEDIDLILLGNSGNKKTDEIFINIEKGIFKNKSIEKFKQYCGEYHTASSFAMWLAVQKVQSEPYLSSILICNHYGGEDFGILLVEKCSNTTI